MKSPGVSDKTSKKKKITRPVIISIDLLPVMALYKGYVKQLDANQRSRVRAMVNIDCVGMTDTKVWVQRADKRLLNALARVASSLELPLEAVNIGEIGDTDSMSFASRRIPVIDIHSITWQNFERLHEGRDTIDTIQMDDYYGTYKLLSVYLGYLDITLD